MNDGLFAMTPVAPPEPEKVSADRARTERQRRVIERGGHPLHAVFPTSRHPDTLAETYRRDDPRPRLLTCGACKFRELMGAGNRTVAKCTVTRQAGQHDDSRVVMPRATSSAASDVRAWWPACCDYIQRETP